MSYVYNENIQSKEQLNLEVKENIIICFFAAQGIVWFRNGSTFCLCRIYDTCMVEATE